MAQTTTSSGKRKAVADPVVDDSSSPDGDRRVRQKERAPASSASSEHNGNVTNLEASSSADYVTWTRINGNDGSVGAFAEAAGYCLRWHQLDEDSHVTQDAYDAHDSADVNSTVINVGQDSLTDIFFDRFLPDLTGSAKLMDEYLASSECPLHTVVQQRNIKFTNTTISSTTATDEDDVDPDYHVKLGFRLLLAAVSESRTGVDALWKESERPSTTPASDAAGESCGHANGGVGSESATSTASHVAMSRPPPDFGRFMDKTMFECFCAAAPYLWVQKSDWFSSASTTIPTHVIAQYNRAMNARRTKILTKVTCAMLGEVAMGAPAPVSLNDDGTPLRQHRRERTSPYAPTMLGPTLQTLTCCDTGVVLHSDCPVGAGSPVCRPSGAGAASTVPIVIALPTPTSIVHPNTSTPTPTPIPTAASVSLPASGSNSSATARWWMPSRDASAVARVAAQLAAAEAASGAPTAPSAPAPPAVPPAMSPAMTRLVQRVKAAALSPRACVGGAVGAGGSVPACVELFERFGVLSVFALDPTTTGTAGHNDAMAFFPHALLRASLVQRATDAGTGLAGTWVVMIADPPTGARRDTPPTPTRYAPNAKYRLIALAYARGSDPHTDIEFYISTCGKTCAARSRVVTSRSGPALPQPALVDFVSRRVQLVHDNSAQLRRNLCIERTWTAQRHNAWFQVLLSIVDLSLANMYAVLLSFRHTEFADTSMRELAERVAGALPLRPRTDRSDAMAVSPGSEASLGPQLPSMAGVVSLGATADGGQDSVMVPLTRIRVDVKPLSPHMRSQGKTVGSQYQRSCWVCRMYGAKYRMTTWKCVHCNTPLCALDRSAEPSRLSRQSCVHEHSTSADPRVRCGGPGSHKGQVPRDLRCIGSATPQAGRTHAHRRPVSRAGLRTGSAASSATNAASSATNAASSAGGAASGAITLAELLGGTPPREVGGDGNGASNAPVGRGAVAALAAAAALNRARPRRRFMHEP